MEFNKGRYRNIEGKSIWNEDGIVKAQYSNQKTHVKHLQVEWIMQKQNIRTKMQIGRSRTDKEKYEKNH